MCCMSVCVRGVCVSVGKGRVEDEEETGEV